MDKIEKALDYFNQGYNCSQSILLAFAEMFELPKEIACRIAGPFGGGIGRHGEICGAVSGAIMVLGLKYGYTDPQDNASKERNYQAADQFVTEFTKRCQYLNCRDLIGYDLSNSAELLAARQQQVFSKRCPEFVRAAATILVGMSE